MKKIDTWIKKLEAKIEEESWTPTEDWFSTERLLDLGLSESTARHKLHDAYKRGELARRQYRRVWYYTDAENAPEYVYTQKK